MTRDTAHELVVVLCCFTFGTVAGLLIGIAIRIFRSLP